MRKIAVLSVSSSLLLQSVILVFPVACGKLIDLLNHGEWNRYILFLCVLLLLPIMQGLLEWSKALYSLLFSESKAMRIRFAAMKRTLFAAMHYFSSAKTGEVITRSTDDIQQLSDFEKMKLEVIEHMSVFTFILVTLFVIHPLLFVIFIIGAILNVIHAKIIFPYFTRLYEGAAETQDLYNEYTRERIQFLPYTKISGSSAWEQIRLERILQQALRLQQSTSKASFLSEFLLKTIESSVTGSVYFAASYLLLQHSITLGDLFVVIALYYPFIQSLSIASQWMHRYQKSRISRGRVEELLRLEEDVYQSGCIDTPPAERIEFNHVSFAYPGRPPVLHQINLTLERGKTVALVGVSGGGKSTLCELLLKLHAPSSGSIIVNGTIDLKDLDGRLWRQQMAYASQNHMLLSGTIKSNLAYGVDVADEHIEQLSGKLGLHEMILEREQQYEERVSGELSGFSGGQRQRMALMRAFLRSDADVLILDEPTSALDYFSERKVMQLIEERKHRYATLIIAHRLSTILNADTIAVLRDGEIVESGTHEELLRKKGDYYTLFQHEMLQKKHVE